MSLDVRRLSEALSAYADEVDVSVSELDRKQRELHQRLGQSRSPSRAGMALAVAAILLLMAVAVAGTLWAFRPDTTVPSGTHAAGSLTGLWSYVNESWGTLLVVRPDGTYTEYSSMAPLVRHSAGDQGRRITNDGQRIVVDSTDPQRQPCRSTQSILTQSEGQMALGPLSFEGAGCLYSSGLAATMTRLSPASPAAEDLPVQTEGPIMPVTDPVQLEGLWLLRGTSLLLAVDQIAGPAAYVMDDDGDLQPAPDAEGRVSVGPDGVVVLESAGCASTVLRRSEVRGQRTPQTLTTVVDSDPCSRFDGRQTLTWIRIL
jgi:hypothetical protein